MGRRTGKTKGGIPKSISRAGGHSRGYSKLHLNSLIIRMCTANAPFSDGGNKYLFNKALKEARSKGAVIKYSAKKAAYYNVEHLDPKWHEYLGIEQGSE
jgi:hypothetical protein